MNGTRVREYIGSGPLAELIAQGDEAERQERLESAVARRQDVAELRAEIADVEEPLVLFRGNVSLLAAGALLCAGYRQHDRGEWRKRNGDDSHGNSGSE